MVITYFLKKSEKRHKNKNKGHRIQNTEFESQKSRIVPCNGDFFRKRLIFWG